MASPCVPCAAGVSRDEDVEPGAVARATDSANGRWGRKSAAGLRIGIEGWTFHQHLSALWIPQHQHEGKEFSYLLLDLSEIFGKSVGVDKGSQYLFFSDNSLEVSNGCFREKMIVLNND